VVYSLEVYLYPVSVIVSSSERPLSQTVKGSQMIEIYDCKCKLFQYSILGVQRLCESVSLVRCERCLWNR
jgi:hypothetical protein